MLLPPVLFKLDLFSKIIGTELVMWFFLIIFPSKPEEIKSSLPLSLIITFIAPVCTYSFPRNTKASFTLDTYPF